MYEAYIMSTTVASISSDVAENVLLEYTLQYVPQFESGK